MNQRDWTEDFSHENGNYECRCSLCNNTFFGHKRRVVCNACSIKSQEKIREASEINLKEKQ